MDSTRFGRIARAFGGHGRRDLLGALGVLGAGAVLPVLHPASSEAKRKKKKKKPNENRCPGGCGFNERCVGNLCVPGCLGTSTPCGVDCCLSGVETCRNDRCVSLCADRRPPCGGVCCGSGQACVDDECAVPCPAGRVRCAGVCCDVGEVCEARQCRVPCPGDCAPFVYATQWGGRGTETGKFKGPNAIAIDSDDRIYVIDAGNDRLQKFDTAGQYLASWPVPGYGLAVAGNQFIYVADGMFLTKYKTDGTWLEHLTASGMSGAQDVAVDDAGNVYVITNALTGKVFVFDAAGNSVTNWRGNNGDFLFADGIAVDSIDEQVYVADTFHHRIQKFDLTGTFDREWGALGSEERKLNSPNGLAIDADGNVFVADYGNDRIQIFESDSGFIGAFGESGSGSGQLNGPAGVALDSAGNAYVADYLNDRIVKFKPASAAGRAATHRPRRGRGK